MSVLPPRDQFDELVESIGIDTDLIFDDEGDIRVVGSTVTSMNIHMLSSDISGQSVTLGPTSPSMLMRNGDSTPPTNEISSMRTASLLELKTFNGKVTEPMVVNTVSKSTVSAEKDNLRSGLSEYDTFPQLPKAASTAAISNVIHGTMLIWGALKNNVLVFMECKDDAYSRYERTSSRIHCALKTT